MLLSHKEALKLLLDHVDYTAGACGITEMVGGVLPKEVIERCHESLKQKVSEPTLKTG